MEITSLTQDGSFLLSLLSKGSFDSSVNSTLLLSVQVERRSPQHHYRARHTLDGAKMRASVRMTRYLESWGAAKPFANLHHRDSMTNENGKINTAVCHFFCPYAVKLLIRWQLKLVTSLTFFFSLSPLWIFVGCTNGAVSLPEEIRKASCSFYSSNIRRALRQMTTC